MMIQISKQQYKDALQAEGVLKGHSIALLTALYDAPSCQATGQQLARLFGYQGFQPINALIGKLGKRMATFLDIDLPHQASRRPGWWRAVVTWERVEDGLAWRLREELFDALVELDLIEEGESRPFPDSASGSGLVEGSTRRVVVNAYERNQTARRICIEAHGPVCKVCGFDFEHMYGDIGAGFIHVHHLLDLAEIGEEYRVDPINDLVPVCPNCHCMLHISRPAMRIEDLRRLVEDNRFPQRSKSNA